MKNLKTCPTRKTKKVSFVRHQWFDRDISAVVAGRGETLRKLYRSTIKQSPCVNTNRGKHQDGVNFLVSQLQRVSPVETGKDGQNNGATTALRPTRRRRDTVSGKGEHEDTRGLTMMIYRHFRQTSARPRPAVAHELKSKTLYRRQKRIKILTFVSN